jgi:hypothetical protein
LKFRWNGAYSAPNWTILIAATNPRNKYLKRHEWKNEESGGEQFHWRHTALGRSRAPAGGGHTADLLTPSNHAILVSLAGSCQSRIQTDKRKEALEMAELRPRQMVCTQLTRRIVGAH